MGFLEDSAPNPFTGAFSAEIERAMDAVLEASKVRGGSGKTQLVMILYEVEDNRMSFVTTEDNQKHLLQALDWVRIRVATGEHQRSRKVRKP